MMRRRGCTLDIRGDDFDCALLVNGGPVLLQWSDGGRCDGQYLVRSGDTTVLAVALRPLDPLLDGGLDLGKGLAAQLGVLVDMFGDGQYSLSYLPEVAVRDVLEYDSSFSFTEDREHFYPGDHMLVATQASERMTPARVEQYRAAIRAGARPLPIAIRVAEGRTSFVLDGHHKLRAYRSLGVPAALVSIERTQAGPIDKLEGLRLLGVARRWADEYLAAKDEAQSS
jgi:hypothetical protein